MFTQSDYKNLLVLINRVPTLTPAEADEFVSLRNKLQAAAADPVDPVEAEPAAG